MDKVIDAKEKAAKLIEQVREREEKAKNKGRELLEKIFSKDADNHRKINPELEELLLNDPKRLEQLRGLLSKAEKVSAETDFFCSKNRKVSAVRKLLFSAKTEKVSAIL